ncbi:MAG: 2-oxoacid:acceptor oxidoreductase family protein [Candidatus Thorarchaeota archaeon]
MNFGKIKQNEYVVKFCGLGGMGIILTSIILGKAVIFDNKNAVQTQSYGPEQRGTIVTSDVIVSDEELISFPIDQKLDFLVAFSQDAYNSYKQKVKRNGFIFINSDLVKINSGKTNIFQIPASSIAKELNNEKVVNLVILGNFVKITNLVSMESTIEAITNTFIPRFVELNINAFNRGYGYL